jgi:FkbM family methyltransferase
MTTGKKRAIVSVAINKPYTGFRHQWLATMEEYGQADYIKIFADWPPDSPSHLEHHYAFKYFAVKHAYDLGYRQILWLDAQVFAVAPIDAVWKEIEKEGHVFAVDAADLDIYCSDQCLEHFGYTREQAAKLKLFSGTWVGLDLDKPRSKSFFNEWGALAEKKGGLFMSSYCVETPGSMRSLLSYAPGNPIVSTDPRFMSHRSDEACFALMAADRKMKIANPEKLFNPRGVLRTRLLDGEEMPECVSRRPVEAPADKPKRTDLELIHEHTIATSLLTKGGYVLDAGSRTFEFSRELAKRGCKVIALDADPTIEDLGIKNVDFMNLALSDTPGMKSFVMSNDPQARHLGKSSAYDDEQAKVRGEQGMVTVKAVTLDWLMQGLGIALFDAIKLDIEGAEIPLLLKFPGPITKQLSIEFHQHCFYTPPETFDAIFAHLSQWYDVIQHESTNEHCAGFNYWNSLLTLRGV